MAESRGLGDSIEKFTKATGIKKVVESAAELVGKKDCGCGVRRDTLNRMFPYKKKEVEYEPIRGHVGRVVTDNRAGVSVNPVQDGKHNRVIRRSWTPKGK